MIQFKQRLRKLESVFVLKIEPARVWDEEYEMIKLQDPEAIALLRQSHDIINEALKDNPDREGLKTDRKRVLAALDLPSLLRLRACVAALNNRVDSLRKKPRRPGFT